MTLDKEKPTLYSPYSFPVGCMNVYDKGGLYIQIESGTAKRLKHTSDIYLRYGGMSMRIWEWR